MIQYYTAFDHTTGEIQSTFTAEAEIVDLCTPAGCLCVPGRYSPAEGYFFDLAFVPYTQAQAASKADRPPHPAEWSNVSMSWVDQRDINAQRAAKWADIKTARDAACSAPIVYAGHTLDGDAASQARLLQARELAQLMPADWTVTWTLADNASADLDVSDLRAVVLAIAARTDAAYQRGRVLRERIDAAATAAELAAITWDATA